MRMGKKRSRAFLEEVFGRPWKDIERELRLRTPLVVEGVEVLPVEREPRLRAPIETDGAQVIEIHQVKKELP